MTEQKKCPECGGAVPKEAPFGHCPACLLRCGADPPPPELKTGGESGRRPHRLGDFELIVELGCGAMGVVYKARQVSLNRLVALKMISPSVFGSEELVDRFLQEAQLAGSLQHPNIVSIYSVGDFEGQPHICMELIQGTRLDQHITKKGFVWNTGGPEEKHRNRSGHAAAVRIMAKVARALHHAHQHGVLHRDIKPGNILLDGGGEPHLTDFGLAKLLGPGATRRTAAGSILGTPCYMAPEQASGETHLVSTAADVYSLGAVLYEMLTGHPPFRGRTPVETIHRLLNEEPKHPTTLNGSVDPDLATICLKCLERAPPRRYSSALALAEDLERWLRREPIEARPVRFLGRVWRWGRREPVLAGMTAGVVALLAALAVLGLTLWQSAKREANDEVTKAEGVMRLLNAEIETKWTNQDSVLILAETLALEANRRLPVGILSVRVVLGVHAHSRRANAVNLFRSCVPLVSALQTNQPMLSNQQVLFDLQMYVSHTNAMEGLLRNEVDLMRLNPATYVLLRQREPSLVPIAQEFCDGQAQLRGAIFTRTDNTNIHRLEDLKGQPFAVDSPASGLGPDVVKAALVKWGFHAGDFGPLIEFPSSDTAIAAVRKGECGAGATELNKVLRYLSITNGLRILTNLQCPSYLWVATKKLDPAILPVVRACLVSLRDPKVLATVGLNVTEIREARAADFDAFEQEIEKAKEFDLPRRQGVK